MKAIFAAAAASLIFCAPAHAAEFDGSYFGVGVNVDNVQATGANEGIGFSGLGGTAFIGHDIPVTSSMFIGGEANVDLYTADVDDIIEANWGYGVSGRVGLNLNRGTALYARAGYARAQLKIDGDKEWGEGLRYGAGIQTRITPNASLRAEITQTDYEGGMINNQAGFSISFGI